MGKNKYDIIVIGAGSAGLSVSLGMHELGFKVLLIDKNDKRIGGECLNDGCVPSKALIHIAKTIHEAKNSGEFGMKVSGEPDFQKVRDYIKRVQDTIREHENVRYLSELGMDVVLGSARFSGKRSVKVNGDEFFAKKIVIATGSKPKLIAVKGNENVFVHTNETLFDMEELPKRLVIIGGGPVGIELSQAFSRLGSEVWVIETLDKILSKEDPNISDILLENLKAEGIKFFLNSTILEFPGSNSIKLESNHEIITLYFNAIIMAVGREVNFDMLEPENAGIQTDERGLVINNFLCTTNKNVFVAGDAANQLNFSHAAELHATLLIKNFFNPIKSKLKYNHFSWVTFTDPQVATFGLNAKSLQEQGIAYEKLEYDFSEDDRAVIDDYRYGKLILFVKGSLIPAGNKKIYGGCMIAPNAGEMIQELVLANSSGLGTKAIFDKIHAYPVASRVNKSIILEKTREEIGPLVKKLLRRLY